MAEWGYQCWSVGRRLFLCPLREVQRHQTTVHTHLCAGIWHGAGPCVLFFHPAGRHRAPTVSQARLSELETKWEAGLTESPPRRAPNTVEKQTQHGKEGKAHTDRLRSLLAVASQWPTQRPCFCLGLCFSRCPQDCLSDPHTALHQGWKITC